MKRELLKKVSLSTLVVLQLASVGTATPLFAEEVDNTPPEGAMQESSAPEPKVPSEEAGSQEAAESVESSEEVPAEESQAPAVEESTEESAESIESVESIEEDPETESTPAESTEAASEEAVEESMESSYYCIKLICLTDIFKPLFSKCF
ncbi:hypothetical protein [Jeotgalibaca caeni]|uniref:hypothetical protein n=1 Tax=Jeotgalibaca caeni TaxID=3028623 RepID=UPI00237D89D2|nr:hypothetical protein [Jeotgalibaca caeni]MDE1550014.1 hypothetical protein [Jeotgalibaca caeni]